MIIGVISAMVKEHAQLTSMLSEARTERDGAAEFTVGCLGDNQLVLMQCGIGKVNAAVGATLLIRRYTPDIVVSTGCAGGLAEDMNVMDIVVSTETAYHDVIIPGCDPGQVQGLPTRFRSEEMAVEAVNNSHIHKLLKSMSSEPERTESQIRCGLIVSGDQFITDATQLQHIRELFPDAIAVDMESAAIAQTCHIMQVPFVSFRILSDTPGADEQLLQYLDFWDRLAERSFEVTRHFLTSLPTRFATLPFEN